MAIDTDTKQKKAPPVARVSAGLVQGAVWRKTTDKGTFYSATFEVRYKDGDTWKSGDSYGAMEVLCLKEAASQAFQAIDQLRAADKKAGAAGNRDPGEEG